MFITTVHIHKYIYAVHISLNETRFTFSIVQFELFIAIWNLDV